MRIKNLVLVTIFLVSGIWSYGQQINPVPDYVFRNQMSVGRNAVTDTAAYFSIGPRYGAVKGFMPPIVGDTSAVTGTKRNGLLIFSVQRNNFMYWDSVIGRWAVITGSVDSTVYSTRAYRQKGDDSLAALINLKVNISDTSSMLTNYVRHAGYGLTKSGQSFIVDTLNISTRAWRQKGIDSVVGLIPAAGVTGSGTTNRVAKFTASGVVGNASIVDSSSGASVFISSAGNVGVGVVPSSYASFLKGIDINLAGGISASSAGISMASNTFYNGSNFIYKTSNPANFFELNQGGVGNFAWYRAPTGTAGGSVTFTQAMTLNNASELLLATTTDAGDFKLQVSGNAYATGIIRSASTYGFTIGESAGLARIVYGSDEANSFSVLNTGNGRAGLYVGSLRGTGESYLASSSGNVGIGTTSPAYKLNVITTAVAGRQNLADIDRTAQNMITFTNPEYSITASMGIMLRVFPQSDARQGAGILASGGAGNGDTDLDLFVSQGIASSTTYSAMKLQGSTGNVGIGNASPSYKLDISGTLRNTTSAYFATSSGNVGIGTTNPVGDGTALNIYGSSFATLKMQNSTTGTTATDGSELVVAGSDWLIKNRESGSNIFYTANSERGRINAAGEFILNSDGTDAGDYKLQVSGNALVTSGKLDITSNANYGISIARSGTSFIAQQIYNSSGILYSGVESSAGGAIFTGSSAYAAVIGSGANYSLQFATNNVTRATITNGGEMYINTLSDQGDYRLQVNGSVYNTGQVTRGGFNIIGTSAQMFIDSTTNLAAISAIQSITGSNSSQLLSGNVTWNTTGNPTAIDVYVTNTASGANANFMKLSDGTNTFTVGKNGSIKTANGGTSTAAAWHLGSVVATSVQLDTANYVEVEIGGTFYRLAIVTPL